MAENHPYNVQLRVQNIGPHENGTLPICMGEKGPFKIGIFSTNGSGKTTLSRQFRLLTQQKGLKEGDVLPNSEKFLTIGQQNGKFKFKFHKQDSTINEEFEISHKKGEVPTIKDNTDFIFHVFNSDYIKDTIEPNNFGPDESINGYIVGKEAVDVSKEKKKLSEVKNQYKKIKDEIDIEIDNAKKELIKIGIRKNTTEYKNINFDNLISASSPSEKESFEALKAKLKKLESIPDDLQDIPEFRPLSYDFDILWNLASDLDEVLSPSSISKDFKEKIRSKENFIESGLSALGESKKDKCPFCEQKLKDQQIQLIDQYTEYFKDAETKYKKRLDNKIEELSRLNSLLQEKHNEFLKTEKKYNKLKDYFPSFSNSSIYLFEDPESKFEWKIYNQVIEEKKEAVSSPIGKEKLARVEKAINNIQTFITEDINQAITSSNKLIRSINKTKKDTNNEVLSLKRRLCKAKFLSIRNSLESNIKSLEGKQDEITSLNKSIESLENKAKHPKKEKVFSEFKRLIKFIFDDKYVFDETENCLKFKNRLLRDSAQDILSDGEKSIIAFCHFLAETHRIVNKESDYDKLFFIVDDPVSSMDFHFTYSISTLLGELERMYGSMTSKVNLRLIILTHNIEFMSILLRNNVLTRSGYVLTPGAINKLNKELIMPYHQHLMDIYKVVEKGVEPNHTTPNSMRHILETINKFESPGNNYRLQDFINDNEKLKSCSGIHTFIQDGSHGYIRDQSAMTPDQVKKGCKTIIEFVEGRYKNQIENIKKSVKRL